MSNNLNPRNRIRKTIEFETIGIRISIDFAVWPFTTPRHVYEYYCTYVEYVRPRWSLLYKEQAVLYWVNHGPSSCILWGIAHTLDIGHHDESNLCSSTAAARLAPPADGGAAEAKHRSCTSHDSMVDATVATQGCGPFG